MESRIKSSEFFIERAKKRVENARKEVEDAKANVVATVPVDFAAELAQLRSLVAELQREREELRFELGQRGVATPAEEGRRRKSIRSLSTPASNLMVPHNQLAISSGSGRNPQALMETLIEGGSAAASHRLHPMQQKRTGHVCLLGESQDTGREACEWAKRLTQGRLVEGWIAICP